MRNLLFVALSCLVFSTSAIAQNTYDDAAVAKGLDAIEASNDCSGASGQADASTSDLEAVMQDADDVCVSTHDAQTLIDNYYDSATGRSLAITYENAGSAAIISGHADKLLGDDNYMRWQTIDGGSWPSVYYLAMLQNYSDAVSHFSSAIGSYGLAQSIHDVYVSAVDAMIDDLEDEIANSDGCGYGEGQGE